MRVRDVAAGWFERSRKGKMAGTDDGNQRQRTNARALPLCCFYIPDFVSLTNTGTEQVLTPQFR
jgi:hypothetical protein